MVILKTRTTPLLPSKNTLMIKIIMIMVIKTTTMIIVIIVILPPPLLLMIMMIITIKALTKMKIIGDLGFGRIFSP